MKRTSELDEFVKPTKIKQRKDRKHFQRQVFDDDETTRKAAGKRGHSRLNSDEDEFDIDLEDSGIDPDELKRLLK